MADVLINVKEYTAQDQLDALMENAHQSVIVLDVTQDGDATMGNATQFKAIVHHQINVNLLKFATLTSVSTIAQLHHAQQEQSAKETDVCHQANAEIAPNAQEERYAEMDNVSIAAASLSAEEIHNVLMEVVYP